MEKNVIINGWYIKHITLNSTDSGLKIFIVNDETGLEIKVPHDRLKVFGFYSAGPCLGVIAYDTVGTLEEQKEEINKILTAELCQYSKSPEWYDIRQYLCNYKGKMRLGKIIPFSKITKDSIKKTIEVIDNEWQEICKKKSNNLN